MKILIKFLLKLILIIAIIVAASIAAYKYDKAILIKPTKYIFEYYLKSKKIDVRLDNLSIKDGKIFIETIKAKNSGELVIKFKDIYVDPVFKFNNINSSFGANILINQIIISTKENNHFFQGEANLHYYSKLFKNHSKFEANLATIDEKGTIKIFGNNINNYKSYAVKANFDKEHFIDIHGEVNKGLKIAGSLENIPISFYKPFHYFDNDNKLLKFIDKFIYSGQIISAQCDINLSPQDIEKENFNKNNVKFLAKIKNLKYVYDDLLPPVSNAQLDVIQEGLLTTFIVNSAKINDITIRDGIILMDWKGINKTVLSFTAKASGPANDLMNFVSIEAQNDLKQADIDLKKMGGEAQIDIKIKIPLKPETKNIYDITADVIDSNLSIFNDKVKFNKIKIVGKYDGNSLKISGDGKINGFNSQIEYNQNFEDKSNFNYKLDINSNLSNSLAKNKLNKKLAFITLNQGTAQLNFQYINQNNENKIFIKSDLKNLAFDFNKLGINKAKGQLATLNITGNLDSLNHADINFTLNGANNLAILGNMTLAPGFLKINAHKLQHQETDISTILALKNNSVNINIQGNSLDLSKANMMRFLQKERDSGTTQIKANIKRVKLKNDIFLDGLNLKLNCDVNKCYEGNIDGFIGSKIVDIKLSAKQDEQWSIKSNNAGAFLKAIGAYNDMRSGEMKIDIRVSRKKSRAGNFVSILNGNFIFNRFVIHDSKSLAKMISIASLPGLLRTISGNKDIVFSQMSGKIHFKNGILTIHESKSIGPFFNFTMKGEINTVAKFIELKGHIMPSLYGASKILGSVPIFGDIFIGGKKSNGIFSAPYIIKEVIN